MAKECSVEWCKTKSKIRLNYDGTIYCENHYKQMKKYGEVIKRSVYMENEISYDDKFAYIHMYNSKGVEVAITKIDKDDVCFVREFKWRLSNGGYAVTSIKMDTGTGRQKILKLHRMIANVLEDDCIVDHIDRDRLNNSKENLRIATVLENSQNRSVPNINSSGVMGVRYNSYNAVMKWTASLTHNKTIYTKSFQTKEEAIMHRLILEYRLLGEEYAPQRHLFEEYGIAEGVSQYE